MKTSIKILFGFAFLLCSFALVAADLTIDNQVNVASKDYANNYFSFKGSVGTVEKDQVVLGADGVTGASKLDSTEKFNAYRTDVKGKKTMPSGLRGLFLFAIADDSSRTGDDLSVTKASNGVITVRYVHRGTAYEFATDSAGKLSLPFETMKTRVIGTTDNKIIHADFSPSGKVTDVNYAKVWDASIADGKQLGTTTSKTGKITMDVANSEIYVWEGSLQFVLTGSTLKITGELNAKVK